MAALRVADVTRAAGEEEGGPDRASFHAVADCVYGDVAGPPPNRASIDRNLTRRVFQNSQCVLVAFDDGTPVGRIVARVSAALRDPTGSQIGMLGFFESMNEPEVADSLFRHAIDWLRERGARQIVGPIDGDTWHRYRLNVGPFERPPFPLEPWNPPYYDALWRGAGFTVVETYSSKWIADVAALLPGLEPGVERSASRGIRIRGLDRPRLSHELTLVHEISSEIFRDAFLYSPISRDEFLALYSGVEGMLDPELVVFAVEPSGRAVGFVFSYTDPHQRAVHYKTIGVLAEWRQAAVAAALSHHVYSNAVRKGLAAGNHALMRDDNRSQALDQGLGEVFRRYNLYEWSGS